jgi:hypothetical protein
MNDTAHSSPSTQSSDSNPSYIDTYAPPAASGGAPTSPTPASSAPVMPVSQSLEDQNIFHLLGVQDGSNEEKEAFLDELQQVIWEDFLENDVELLLTEEEVEGLRKIRATTGKSELELQEDIVVYLEKLIPDLEEILLEKALELKEDMVKERIAGMREFFANQPDQLRKLDEAETLIADDQWRSAAELLNSAQA